MEHEVKLNYSNLRNAFLENLGVILVLLGCLGTIGIFTYQIYAYLQFGFWVPISLVSALGWLKSEWALNPTQWIGFHSILDFLPLSVASFVIGIALGWFVFPVISSSENIASSTDSQSPETANTKNNDDVKPLRHSAPTKIPDGLAGLDLLAKYAKNEELAEAISTGPRVVVASFDVFKKGDIVDLQAIGRARCYLNGIAVEKSIVAENTRSVDRSGIEAHFGN